ncbi:DUF3224 domain-containing protein [Myxococcus qinghaiensis]|uniref:DUF3224 domain-containing protein n=1 Tax=Myxococcus qinghaiensis TaxID=2906758 RepID=UPI0020A784FB|nr:DUF3224 domain-containing protein [Myxococcus qinghaiensis]MCP3168290.1 DUF3224 domain-containing protein [Myxococcus qinghaiensis]
MMKARTMMWTWVLGAVLAQGCAGSQATVSPRTGSETNMTKRVQGPFDVKVKPLAPDEGAAATPIGRMSIDKRYHGDLEGTGVGQMLATMDDGKSGAYVALERVTGSLQGRKGSFSIHHTGRMTRGAPELSILVVPDSGTDELKGLTGSMQIQIDEKGGHTYVFEYALPDAP